MGALFTDIAKIGQSSEPDMHGKLVVFDPAVFSRTKGLLSDWSSNRSNWQKTYGQWKSDFDAATPEFKANVDRENDYLKYLQGGGFEKTLAALRAKAGAADTAEENNALDFAGGYANRARINDGTGSGSSSADFARRLRAGSRIEAEFAPRAVDRERSDLSQVNQIKLGTMGRINQNLEALINRQLRPQDLSDHELTQMVASLGGIQGLRMGSASPVFWRQTGLGEQLAAPLDDALSIAASFYGGKANSAPDNNPQLGQPSGGPQAQEYNRGSQYEGSFGSSEPMGSGTQEGAPSAWGSASQYDYTAPGYNKTSDYAAPSWIDAAV